LYVGGWFTQIGPLTGGGVAVSRTSGSPTGPLALLNGHYNGEVFAAVSDRHGGYYVGGLFTTIGGVARKNLAHVLADGNVDSGWNPGANSFVETLAASGSSVYAGGWFTSIGAQRRRYLAALNATTGRATAWNPGANGYVEAVAVSRSTVYAGGYFTRLGGKTRHYIAAMDAGTGRVRGWNPNAAGNFSGYTRVDALAVSRSAGTPAACSARSAASHAGSWQP